METTKMRKYIWNLLIALDQFSNALSGGDPDETISSRVSKSNTWPARIIRWALECVDPGHTTRAKEADEGKDETV